MRVKLQTSPSHRRRFILHLEGDPTFFDVKTDHNGMGFSIEYKKIDNGDTTHVKGTTNGYVESNKALESVKKNQ